PRDILVMTVDIDTYAPYIESVFGSKKTEDNGACFIPYSIADRNIRAQSALSRGFEKIFSLSHKGFAASAVTDLLLLPPVKAKFGFTEEDFDTVRGWMESAAIRWGRDGNDRVKRCGESFSEFSWEYGIDRLMMGFSAGDTGLDLVEGISSAGDIEGSEYDLLSRFISVYRRLSEITDFCAAPHSVDDWKYLFSCVVEEFFEESDEYSWEFDSFRVALADYASGAAKASFAGDVGLPVALDVLFGSLSDHAVQYGFLNGRVTFCAMLPMRSVPFRVIAVLGLDDRSFPLSTKLPSFDLMGKHPAAGDRSKRNDDRYLFLETIMSAKDFLYLSYNGRSPYDNSVRPPSVILRELCEYIRDNFDMPGGSGEKLVDTITVDHHLHLFNPAYFGGSERLYSYSSGMCDIASACAKNLEPAAFECGLSSEIPESFNSLSPDELKKFFRKPVRWFCTERLGLRIPVEGSSLQDEEPLEMEFENRLILSDVMIRRICGGESASDCFDWARASGMIPPLEFGMKELEDLAADAEKVGARMRALMKCAPSTRAVDFSIESGGRRVRVHGDVTDIYDDLIVRGRMTHWSTDDIDMWLDHLLVCATGTPVATVFVSRDGILTHEPIGKNEACERLSELISVYLRGLVRPVHLFPKSSREYAAQHLENENPDVSLYKARAVWLPNVFKKGGSDSEDPYHYLCFGGHPGFAEGSYPLDDEFTELSVLVYGKLLAAREESHE
ncbi:MAG TPA: exodeoxyribonuclease V subunit gamma, partial [Spirochaetota bacterium]|nr:exodeoxyribonuclease V subunit gamma [Spirochaetota bacterium]